MADWATKYPTVIAIYTAYLCTTWGWTSQLPSVVGGPKGLYFPSKLSAWCFIKASVGKGLGKERESHCWSSFDLTTCLKWEFCLLTCTSQVVDETMHRSWKYKVEVGSTILSYFNATRVIIPLCLKKKKNETSSHGWYMELLNHCYYTSYTWN